MAKKAAVNKSQFIRDELTKNAKASAKDVQDAWAKAGNKDKLNPVLYYVAKKNLGLSKGRKRRKAAAGNQENGNDSIDGDIALYRLEADLDALIERAKGDAKVVESLRAARRQVSARLVAKSK